MQSLSLALLSTFILIAPAQARLLTEASILELAKKESPTMRALNLNLLAKKLEFKQSKDAFDFKLKASGDYLKTNERQLNAFIPVTSPVYQFETQVERPTKYGVNFAAGIQYQETSNNFILNNSTEKASVAVSVDLWRNLLGRTTKNQIKSAKRAHQAQEVKTSIEKRVYLNSLRKIYWGLVYNNESTELTKRLMVISKKQVAEAKKRLRSKIADKGEVARYQSQVAGRESQILYLNYQREQLYLQLKQFLPAIAEEKLQLDKYSLAQTADRVMACVARIQAEAQTPVQFTQYDEYVGLLEKSYKYQQRVSGAYNSPDLTFQTSLAKIGRGIGHGAAYDDLTKNGQDEFAVGVQLEIPLGNKRAKSEKTLETINKEKFLYESTSQLGKMHAFHSEIYQSISLLNQAIRKQRENTAYLSQSLEVSKKKYRQARISVEQLVNEQDLFFQSQLNEISTKKVVIDTLLDYFNVFTEFPCEFNKVTL